MSSVRDREYLAHEVPAIERRHRRLLIGGLALLAVFAFGPLLSGWLSIATSSWLGAYEHLGNLCLAALHVILSPIRGTFHVVLAIGLIYASFERGRAWRRHQAIIGALDSVPVRRDSLVGRQLDAVGLDCERVRVVSGLPTPALTVGWFAPRVLVSDRLVDILDAEQLRAVLAHEASHVRRRDPARMFAMRFVARTLFWLPAFQRLADDLSEEVEVLADDEAVRRLHQSREGEQSGTGALVLASAIVQLAAKFPVPRFGPARAHGIGAGLLHAHEPGLLDRRVRRLAGQRAAAQSHVTRMQVGTAVLALGVFWGGLFPSLHPMAGAGHADPAHHCEHRGLSVFTHLFCECDDATPATVHGGAMSTDHCSAHAATAPSPGDVTARAGLRPRTSPLPRLAPRAGSGQR